MAVAYPWSAGTRTTGCGRNGSEAGISDYVSNRCSRAAAAPEGLVVALPRVDLDVTVQADVQEAVAACRPEVVVNCAGGVDVDGHEVDPDRSRRINVDAPRFLREACETVNAHLVHI